MPAGPIFVVGTMRSGSTLFRLILDAHPNIAISEETGFMGGLTTYSSFNYETTALAAQGASTRALLNVGVTLIGCMLAGLVGIWLARRIA